MTTNLNQLRKAQELLNEALKILNSINPASNVKIDVIRKHTQNSCRDIEAMLSVQ